MGNYPTSMVEDLPFIQHVRVILAVDGRFGAVSGYDGS